jgi:hypothetical protein
VLSNESQAILATQVFANEMALKRRNELWVIESIKHAEFRVTAASIRVPVLKARRVTFYQTSYVRNNTLGGSLPAEWVGLSHADFVYQGTV